MKQLIRNVIYRLLYTRVKYKLPGDECWKIGYLIYAGWIKGGYYIETFNGKGKISFHFQPEFERI